MADAETESQESRLPSPDASLDDPSDLDDTPRITSLRPSSASSSFSMRRLLNWASLVLVGVLLLAAAVRWRPSAPSKQPDAQPTRTSGLNFSAFPLERGTNWQPIGPDWATDIRFTANGALGYACGSTPSNPITFFAMYDVHQNTWKLHSTPATSGDGCRVYTSPSFGDYVLLAVDYCPLGDDLGACSNTYLASHLYYTFDSGDSWTELRLPGLANVYGAAWANSMLYLAVRGNLSADSTSIPLNAPNHLLASQDGRTFTEIGAQQLVGHAMQFGNISLLSNGMTLYASLDVMSCDDYCTITVHGDVTGTLWSPISASYRGSPITLVANQLNSHTLIGRMFLPQSGDMLLLRSDDDGSTWRELPALPRNPGSGGAAIFLAPDNTIYAWCYGPANAVYALQGNATRWHPTAPLPSGIPVTMQYDAGGHAVALWGQAHQQIIPDSVTPGLAYYPLAVGTP